MKTIPRQAFVPAPEILYEGTPKPKVFARVTLRELCDVAQIQCRVSGGYQLPILLCRGSAHFHGHERYYVGVGDEWRPTRVRALRALEALAHSFHDYAARECVCRPDVFGPPNRPPGRPPLGNRAMTPKERMRKMRRARAESRA
jgi:hypothetical protein